MYEYVLFVQIFIDEYIVKYMYSRWIEMGIADKKNLLFKKRSINIYKKKRNDKKFRSNIFH